MKNRSQHLSFTVGLFVIIFCTGGLSAQDNEPILDTDITVTSFEKMPYPPIARQARVQGLVVAQVKLDVTGKVASATALSGARLLIDDSLANVRKWRFRPNAHKAAIVVYEFRLSGGKCKPGKTRFVYHEPNFAIVTDCPDVWQP